MARLYSFLACQALPARPIGVGGSPVRIQPNRLSEVGNGPVILLLSYPGGATVAVGRGVLRIEADGVGEVGNGSVVVVLCAQARPRSL